MPAITWVMMSNRHEKTPSKKINSKKSKEKVCFYVAFIKFDDCKGLNFYFFDQNKGINIIV